MGKLVERFNFGKIKERGEMPHFLEFQLILMKILFNQELVHYQEKIKD